MNELEQVKELLTGGHGWVAAVLSWIGLARAGIKPWSAKLQAWISGIVNFVVASPEQDDDAFLAKVLASRPYRITAFLMDMLASVKLPTSATLAEAEKNKANGSNGANVGMILVIAGAAWLMVGCAHLQPGADPIVVRAEQSLTVAQATFDTFLKLDNADRALVRERLPAVHAFAEWLRVQVPFTAGSDVKVARWAAMVESAEQVKLAYKRNRTPENKANLVTALATLDVALVQTEQRLAELKTINP